MGSSDSFTAFLAVGKCVGLFSGVVASSVVVSSVSEGTTGRIVVPVGGICIGSGTVLSGGLFISVFRLLLASSSCFLRSSSTFRASAAFCFLISEYFVSFGV